MSDDLPRADEPVPPGMVVETFWQRSATHAALFLTATMYAIPLIRALILWTPPDREALADAVEPCLVAWLAAAGVHRFGPTGMRWR